VWVTTPALPGEVFTNRIRFIDPNLDPASASAKVRVEMPNPQRRLRHRLSADVRAAVVISNVLAIPRSAVLNPGGKPRVFVELTPGRYAMRAVKLGRVGDSLIEVLDGVALGERVVSQGGFLLDAQAQLAGLEPAGESAPVAAATAAPSHADLSASEVAAIRKFIQEADALVRALADDELHAFHGRLETFRAAAAALPSNATLDTLAGVTSLIPDAAAAGNTLAEARKAFYPLSQRLVAIGRQLRTRTHGFDDLHLFQCPMTKRSFPDAPSNATWIQLDRVQHNPWLGREMPDCGTELQP
jgi:membrane fusion protein, copper/silver efflux system